MCLADVAEELFLIVGERVCHVKTRCSDSTQKRTLLART